MEAGDSVTWHRRNPSSTPTASLAYTLPHPHRSYTRQSVNGPYLDQPAMAAATVLPPTSHYQSSSSYSSGYPQQPSNMISPESRRPSDETDSSARQLLPSISEVISGTRPDPYIHLRPNLPAKKLDSSFQSTVPPLSEVNRRSSPHGSSAFPIRQDPMPAFPDESRPPYNGRHSLPQITNQHMTPPSRHEVLPPHHNSESQKPPESHHVNGNYSHHPPSTHSLPPYQPGQLPPGQHPLPPYQISPRNGSSHGHSHYDHRALPHRHEDHEYDTSRPRYEPPRPFESWNYQEALGRIGTCSRTVFNFAEAYGRIASEQQSTQPIPTRLPSDREVGEMLSNVEYLKRSLEQVREIILATIQSERAREGARYRGAYEEDPDVHMYSDSLKPHYMSEVKKRRGRAAPPGRCHSCNRIDTPEWRRGPDGARTLCNACGLHYAKLERKRQSEAKALLPQPQPENGDQRPEPESYGPTFDRRGL